MLASIRHNKKRFFSYLPLLVIGVLFCFSLFSPLPVFADSVDGFGIANDSEFAQATELGSQDIRIVIAKIIRAFLGLLGIVAVSIVVYAGYIWMTSGGNEERIATAKKMMINGAIGLAIILSSFSIVQFILGALSNAINPPPSIQTEGPPPFDSFAGSGGLGHIVQDHYPFRDQSGVARNTKIVVTFREPIDPQSIIVGDTPVGDAFGLCRNDDDFDWSEDCDQLDTAAVSIARSDSPDTPVSAAVTIAYDGPVADGNAKTFVFRPLDLLGDDLDDVEYTVQLTDAIKKKNGGDAFDQWPPYSWSFETGTAVDFSPPHVTQTWPNTNATIFRNSIIQLTFNEPIDPTLVQGQSGPESAFTNIVFGAAGVTVEGTWSITNGYRTVEFVPAESCGFNSCGEIMYCLPAEGNCDGAGVCENTDYDVLVRTAATVGNTWEAIPFTGVADIAGNALDSTPLGIRDGKAPLGVPPQTIGLEESVPDNYLWSFAVKPAIDNTVPHLMAITPAVDQANVLGNTPLTMTFSHTMWLATLDDIELMEHGEIPEGESLDDIWFIKRSELVGSGDSVRTKTELLHREFGPNNLDLFYFVSVPGSAKATNQQCLYPGRGPAPEGFSGVTGADGQNCSYSVNPDGSDTNIGCVPVDPNDDSQDTGCAYDASDILFGSVDECIAQLQSVSINSAQ